MFRIWTASKSFFGYFWEFLVVQFSEPEPSRIWTGIWFETCSIWFDSIGIWLLICATWLDTMGTWSETIGNWSETIGTWSETWGNWSEIIGTWSETIGSWSETIGTWFETIGSWSEMIGTWSETIGSWSETIGTWSETIGSWSETIGTWFETIGTWSETCGTWSDTIGNWLLDWGSWLETIASWLLTWGSWSANGLGEKSPAPDPSWATNQCNQLQNDMNLYSPKTIVVRKAKTFIFWFKVQWNSSWLNAVTMFQTASYLYVIEHVIMGGGGREQRTSGIHWLCRGTSGEMGWTR